MKSKRGFTLLEMVVATLIMGIAVVGLLAGISGATRNAARLRDYDRIVQLSRLRMNELLVDQRMPLNTVTEGAFDPALSAGLDAGWRAQLTTFEMPPGPSPGLLALQQVRLDVWWMEGSQKHTLYFEALRRKTLRPEDIPAVGP